MIKKKDDEALGKMMSFVIGIMLITGGIFTLPFGLLGIIIGIILISSSGVMKNN